MVFANAARIKNTNFLYRTEGAYSLIFVDEARAHALKVFRRKDDADEEHCRRIFAAETEAYQIAMASPDLKQLVPIFYGIRTDTNVLDDKGRDATAHFIPGLAYEMQFIQGAFCKIGSVSQVESERIKALFGCYGICHLSDASVLLSQGRIIKVIDFAIKEYELWHRS